MKPFALLSPFFVVTMTCCQQPEKPSGTPEQDGKRVLEDVLQQLKAEGIELDAKAQTVTVPAVVNQPQDPIEYVLIHKRGKRHEALFMTRSKPSVLNAALLMLGLQPGQNATATEKQPPPTLEEIEKGADPLIVTPPKGTSLWMTVRWKTPEGKQEEVCIEDLVLDLTTQEAVVDCSWVYLGGRMARLYKNEPEVYVADFEGNLISVCYMSPDNHLGTIVHKDARDQQNWWFTNKMPAPGTEVQFVFHKQRPAIHVEREKRKKQEAEAKAGKKDERPGDAGK
jgi:hypothetical protein